MSTLDEWRVQDHTPPPRGPLTLHEHLMFAALLIVIIATSAWLTITASAAR